MIKYIFLDFFIYASLFFALVLIFNNNPIYSVFSLILVFLSSAIILLIIEVEFLAFILVIVYVGAVAILFLFVIMLLNIRSYSVNLRSKNSYVLLVTLFYNVLLIFDNLLDIRFIYHNKFSLIAKDTISEQMLREAFFNNDITIFGCLMYTHYYYLFIVAG
jgi:NADH-quinone oxidoreductase subunit J